MSGTLFVVATPIGNLEDVSARALRTLREVALIAAEDTRRTAHLLDRYGITTRTTSLHQHNEAAKLATLIARLKGGEHVALVSDAGTPGVSDPGRQLVAAALDAGIRVEPIPGPSAVVTALMASGFDSDQFVFLGFPPIKSVDRKKWFDGLLRYGMTVVFFEAPHRLHETLRQLHRVAGDTTVAIGRELTKAHEELVKGPILSFIERWPQPRGEFTLVAKIGQLIEHDRTQESEAPSDAFIATQFGQLIESKAVSRRKAINVLSKRLGIPPNQVYAALERAKKSVD